jgi:hypothetical protein
MNLIIWKRCSFAISYIGSDAQTDSQDYSVEGIGTKGACVKGCFYE